MTKKYVERGASNVQYRMDKRSIHLVREIVDQYKELTGKRVSTSAVVRRAVALLDKHLRCEDLANEQAHIEDAHRNHELELDELFSSGFDGKDYFDSLVPMAAASK